MAAGATYTPIATTTSSSSSTITFSSIPSTYTDLVLVISGANSGSGVKSVQFNSDTGANYSCTTLIGNGSTAYSGSYSTAYLDVWNAGTNDYNTIVQFQNYSNSTTYKTYLSRQNTAAVGTEAIVGLWRSTAAISTIAINISSNNFGTTTTFSLYGITAA
jgi:hypothetical protein